MLTNPVPPPSRFQFESIHAGDHVKGAYYSTDRMSELNKQFGDIWHKVRVPPQVHRTLHTDGCES